MTLTPDMQPDSSAIWLSISELADIKRVTKQSISERVAKLEAADLITTRPGKGKSKLVNVAEYDRALGETSNLSKQQGAQTKKLTTADGMPSAKDDEPRGAASSSGFTAQQTLRAGYDAEMKRLDLEERLDNLCNKAEVEARTFGVFRKVRDRMMALPAMCAPRLQNTSDERAARAILDEEIRKTLAAMVKDLESTDDDAPFTLDDDEEVDEAAPSVAPGQEASKSMAAAAALQSEEGDLQ